MWQQSKISLAILFMTLFVKYATSSKLDGQKPGETGVENSNPRDVTVLVNEYKAYYVYEKLKLNWFEAYAHCRVNNMALATLSTEFEALFVRNTLINKNLMGTAENPNNYWLSLNDMSSKGSYMWMSTGKPLSLATDWLPGQPSHSQASDTREVERCVEMAKNDQGKVGWNDHYCNAKQGFICEK